MVKDCFIIIDGTDRIGKSTQIKLLNDYFKKNHQKTFVTRCIGGPQGIPEYDYMQSLRDIIFNNSLPAYAEERIIALASELNLCMIHQLKNKRVYNCFIQDRGVLSHIAYGLTKGNSRNHLEHYYKQVLYQINNVIPPTINICMLPDDFKWFQKRLEKKSETTQRHLELENIKFQKNVCKNMLKEFALSKRKQSKFLNIKNSQILLLKEEDSIEQVHQKIINIITTRI